MNTKHVTVVLTHKCNLSCIYCYEHDKDALSITPAIATSLLEKELNADNDYDEIEIDLFGGEPFCAFDSMKAIFDFLSNGSFKKAWRLSTITNGTKLTDEMKSWLSVNRRLIDCVLSLDGTPNMQNSNRGNGTYDSIDLAFFKEVYPDIPVKMTISPMTLPMLADGTVHLHKLGFKVNNSFANGVKWAPGSSQVLKNQADELVNFYLNNPQIDPCAMMQFPYERVYCAAVLSRHTRVCDAGTKLTCYDVDGKAYPCQQFLPISGLKHKRLPGFPPSEIPHCLLEKECRECALFGACQFCYGANWITKGSIFRRDESLCELEKVLFKSKVKLSALMWDAGLINLSFEEEKKLLLAIQAVCKIPVS